MPKAAGSPSTRSPTFFTRYLLQHRHRHLQRASRPTSGGPRAGAESGKVSVLQDMDKEVASSTSTPSPQPDRRPGPRSHGHVRPAEARPVRDPHRAPRRAAAGRRPGGFASLAPQDPRHLRGAELPSEVGSVPCGIAELRMVHERRGHRAHFGRLGLRRGRHGGGDADGQAEIWIHDGPYMGGYAEGPFLACLASLAQWRLPTAL